MQRLSRFTWTFGFLLAACSSNPVATTPAATFPARFTALADRALSTSMLNEYTKHGCRDSLRAMLELNFQHVDWQAIPENAAFAISMSAGDSYLTLASVVIASIDDRPTLIVTDGESPSFTARIATKELQQALLLYSRIPSQDHATEPENPSTHESCVFSYSGTKSSGRMTVYSAHALESGFQPQTNIAHEYLWQLERKYVPDSAWDDPGAGD